VPEREYVQNDVEQWVRQQNASRHKQDLYANQIYRSCDEIRETRHYQYRPVPHKTMSSSLGPARAQSSSIDYVGPAGYGNMDAAMNIHHFRDESYKVPDEHLTMEQRQQRQSKMEWLLAVQHMLTEEQQAEHVDQMRGANFRQSRVPSSISWNSVPCGGDMSADPCNSGNHIMNANYASSAMRHDCYVPSWDAVPRAQHRWYHMQREHCMNKTGMQDNFDDCQSADICNRRYFGPHAPSGSLAESCQQSVRDRMMASHAMCDCMRLHSLRDPQACACHGGMSSHTGKYYMQPGDMYGYTDVGIQPNFGSQQQINRCSQFVNSSYVMPVGSSRQLTNSVPSKCQADMKSWNSAVDVVKQRHMAAPALVQGQEVMLTPQQNSYYTTDGHTVAQSVSTPISCAPTQMATVPVRQKQPCGKKRKNSNILTARLSDSKSGKLDSVADEWPCAESASRAGTLMNITSASLAHLAKGVENMSAVMQQTVQKGGPFQSIRGRDDGTDGFDENANFISAGNSQQVQMPGVGNSAEQPAVPDMSVTSPFCTFQTAGSNSICSLTTVSRLSIENSDVSTSGVDVVVTSKTPYTISYRPSGVSESVSQGNVDASVAAHTLSSGHRLVPSGEGFSQYSHQEHYGMTRHKNPAGAAKVNQQAAAACTPLPISMASSVAVVQPQMMSGTQLFIADRCPELTPVLDNFVLPTCVPSTTFRPVQSRHSLPDDPNYRGFTVHDMSVSVGGSDILVFCSSPNAVKLNTDHIFSSVCTSDGVKSVSDGVPGGSPLSRCSQTNTGFWHQASVSVCSRSFSQAHDAICAVQNALPGSGISTTQT